MRKSSSEFADITGVDGVAVAGGGATGAGSSSFVGFTSIFGETVFGRHGADDRLGDGRGSCRKHRDNGRHDHHAAEESHCGGEHDPA
jgi:hypothetical protein